ncbi:MAG TPA: GrpB family protein [Caulobacteraceae bacterium]|nr:GrpB family protein [Caulobacteraceae bacterium]
MTTRPPTDYDKDDAVRLIAREVMNRPVELSPYDPAWPVTFERLAAGIRGAIGPAAVAIHHAGSTSVPGLTAKPVIDIVMAVPDSSDEAAYVPGLEAIGYALHVRETDWFEHRLLKFVDPTVNMHVFTVGCSEIDRMLAFRDWLRTHDDDRALYQAEKLRLGAQTWTFMQDYADAKTAVVEAIIARATGGSPA